MRNPLFGAVTLLCGFAAASAQGPAADDYNGLSGKNAFVPVSGPADYTTYGNLIAPNAYPITPQNIYANMNPGGGNPLPPSPMIIPPNFPAFEPPGDVGNAAAKAADAPPKLPKDCFYGDIDFMAAWVRNEHVNAPLVTQGASTDAHPGAIGQPGTTQLFGDPIDFGTSYGLRAEAGVFLDEDRHFSLDWVGLVLFPNQDQFSKTSDASGNPVIARPVVNALNGQQAAFVDSFPGLASGGATVDAKSLLLGTEFNMTYHYAFSNRLHLDTLFGFRYLYLSETLNAEDQLNPTAPGVFTYQGNFVNPPNSLSDMDHFQTTNSFYGLQFGTALTWEGDWFRVSTYAKIAGGATDEHANISGSTTFGNQSAMGGILALPSNIGGYERTVFGFVPEGGFNIGFNLTQNIELMAGYSFIYWNDVARPGSQIDPVVNPTQVPSDSSFGHSTGPSRPTFAFNPDSFWVQTLNIGLGIHF